jgi:hypothetical protein
MGKVPLEIVDKIRADVLGGKPKRKAAREFGLCASTVRKYTKDLPTPSRRMPISAELKRKIRNEIKGGKSRAKVAKESNIPIIKIYEIAKDLPPNVHRGRRSGTDKRSFEKLQKILDEFEENGYLIFSASSRRFVPEIIAIRPEMEIAVIENKCICYLEGKEQGAIFALLAENPKRVTDSRLSSISKVFGVKLSKTKKRRLKRLFRVKKKRIDWAPFL